MSIKGKKDVQKQGDTNSHHSVLWYQTNKVRTKAIIKFLKDGGKDNDILVIVLPLREFKELELSFKQEKFSVERYLKEERLFFFASEEFFPDKLGRHDILKNVLVELGNKARNEGRCIRIIGRIAPILFDLEFPDEAMAIENLANTAMGNVRILCLYESEKFTESGIERIESIDEVHAKSFYETDKGEIKLKGR